MAGLGVGQTHSAQPAHEASKAPAATSDQGALHQAKVAAAEAQTKRAEAVTGANGYVEQNSDFATRSILQMAASSPNTTISVTPDHSVEEFMSDHGNNSRTEIETQVWGNTLDVKAINQPSGPNGNTFNSVEVTYTLPRREARRLEQSHVTATSLLGLNLASAQLKTFSVQPNTTVEHTETLTAQPDGGYQLANNESGPPVAVTQVDQINPLAQSTINTLDNLRKAQ